MGLPEMRRKNQQLGHDDCVRILDAASFGTLALIDDDGYPYAVPLSFVRLDADARRGESIGFHCAIEGHKLDLIRKNANVVFTVVGRDDVVPEGLTTKYESVVVRGKAQILEDDEEIRRVALALGAKYSSEFKEKYVSETENTIRAKRLCCVRIEIEQTTGKMGRALLVERRRAAAASTDAEHAN